LSRPSFFVLSLLDLDPGVARDFLPGFDVARVDIAQHISSDEFGGDAEAGLDRLNAGIKMNNRRNAAGKQTGRSS
jgi:hypothetical protein